MLTCKTLVVKQTYLSVYNSNKIRKVIIIYNSNLAATVLQGKRAKLYLFQFYGHNFLAFSFQPITLIIHCLCMGEGARGKLSPPPKCETFVHNTTPISWSFPLPPPPTKFFFFTHKKPSLVLRLLHHSTKKTVWCTKSKFLARSSSHGTGQLDRSQLEDR